MTITVYRKIMNVCQKKWIWDKQIELVKFDVKTLFMVTSTNQLRWEDIDGYRQYNQEDMVAQKCEKITTFSIF